MVEFEFDKGSGQPGVSIGDIDTPSPTEAASTQDVMLGGNIVKLSTTTVQTDVGTKQDLYTVPAGKICVPTLVIVRAPSASLGDMADTVTVGFDGGASNVLSFLVESVSGLTTATSVVGGTPSYSSATIGTAYTVGVATDVLGIIFADDSITATVAVDCFGYLIDA